MPKLPLKSALRAEPTLNPMPIILGFAIPLIIYFLKPMILLFLTALIGCIKYL